MPRTRRKRRRRSGGNPAAEARGGDLSATDPRVEVLTAETARAGRRLPPATVVLALCLGIWIGLILATNSGSGLQTIALWVSVIGAGLSAGRLLRRWLQRRSARR